MRAILILIAVASLSAPALAQTRLPRTSPAERQVESINRSLSAQQRQLRSQQQNQFELNQLRQDLSRQRTAPTLTGPNAVRTCPPGLAGC